MERGWYYPKGRRTFLRRPKEEVGVSSDWIPQFEPAPSKFVPSWHTGIICSTLARNQSKKNEAAGAPNGATRGAAVS